jgi:hypothetical protein
VWAIGAGHTGTSFCYTIGNHEKGLPELLCIGNFPMKVIGNILNIVGYRQREFNRAPAEGLYAIGHGYQLPVKIRKCGDRAKTDYTIQVGQYYNTEEYDVYQVILSDKNKLFPGDLGCSTIFDVDQP